MILYFLILQDIQYNLYGYVLPFFYYNVISFSFFIKNNFFNIIIKPNKKDKLVKKNLFKKSNNKSYTLFAITNLLPLILFIFLSIGYNQIIWFNHLKINNFNVGLSLFIILFLFLLIFCYLGIHNINANYTVDYIFSVCLISSFLPFLFLANTIYTLVFILELNSSLVFYKFVTSNF